MDPATPGRSSYEPLAYRADHAPWGTVAVRSMRDRRPSRELQRQGYFKDSYSSDALFDRPIPSMLARLLQREFVATGVFERAIGATATGGAGADYFADVTIRHFYARFDRDALSLIPILPTIDIECRIELDVVLTDRDGRRFVDRRFAASDTTSTAAVANPDAVAAALLGRVLERVVGDLIRECDASIPRFWQELGRSPPDPRRNEREP